MADEPKDSPSNPELDPELVKLPRPSTQVRPILSLAIIAICLTLTLRLWSDLRFGLESETPQSVESIDALSPDHTNQFVAIQAIPDRPQALRLLPVGGTTGPVIVPTLGSSGKLWLLLAASPWNAAARADEVYDGRLLSAADTVFADALREHLKTAPPSPRSIPVANVKEAIVTKKNMVADIAGEPFAVTADTPIDVTLVNKDQAKIVAVSTDPYNDEASWTLALNNAGILPAGLGPVSATQTSWTFHVPAPNGVVAVAKALEGASLFAARAEEITSTRKGTWSDLSVEDGELHFAADNYHLAIQHIAIAAPSTLPADAYILDATERPDTYWYVPAVVIGLGFVALLFAFGIIRGARRA